MDYYEDARTGLGAEFTKAIDIAIEAIVDAPERWPVTRRGLRKYVLKRFPYCLMYKFLRDEGAVEFFSVFHSRRKPGSWRP